MLIFSFLFQTVKREKFIGSEKYFCLISFDTLIHFYCKLISFSTKLFFFAVVNFFTELSKLKFLFFLNIFVFQYLEVSP